MLKQPHKLNLILSEEQSIFIFNSVKDILPHFVNDERVIRAKTARIYPVVKDITILNNRIAAYDDNVVIACALWHDLYGEGRTFKTMDELCSYMLSPDHEEPTLKDLSEKDLNGIVEAIRAQAKSKAGKESLLSEMLRTAKQGPIVLSIWTKAKLKSLREEEGLSYTAAVKHLEEEAKEILNTKGKSLGPLYNALYGRRLPAVFKAIEKTIWL